MVIEERKISMDPGKLAGIKDWPAPTTVKQTQKFLGFRNFYQQFIQHFSLLTKPLNDLLKKDQQFNWTTEFQQAFETLKKQFTEEPVLVFKGPVTRLEKDQDWTRLRLQKTGK